MFLSVPNLPFPFFQGGDRNVRPWKVGDSVLEPFPALPLEPSPFPDFVSETGRWDLDGTPGTRVLTNAPIRFVRRTRTVVGARDTCVWTETSRPGPGRVPRVV